MVVERLIFLIAGCVILISLFFAIFSKWWLLLTALVGINMVQSFFTGFCPAAIVLKKFGIKSGPAFEDKE